MSKDFKDVRKHIYGIIVFFKRLLRGIPIESVTYFPEYINMNINKHKYIYIYISAYVDENLRDEQLGPAPT